jgi:multidrug efflux pump subunit AcrA (membrane-fusion protein)
MNTTPRVRRDLTAKPSQEGEITYIDVRDPLSGGSLRLYEHEWLIAQQMDGQRTFVEVAAWARSQFEWQPSPEDLKEYAERLGELGFLALDGAGASQGEPVRAGREDALPAGRGAPLRPTPQEFDAASEAESARAGAAGRSEESQPAMELSAARVIEPPRPPSPPPQMPPAPPRAAPLEAHSPAARPAPPMPSPGAHPSASPPGMTPSARSESTPPPPAMREPPSLPPPEAPGPRREVPAARATTAMAVPPASDTPAPAADRPSSGSGLKIFLFAILAVALGGGGFWAYQTFAPGVQAVPITTIKAPEATTVSRYYPGTSKVQGSAPVVVSFEQAGKVASAVEAGGAVKAGDPLVTLEGYASLAKTLTDVRDREKYYLSKNDPIKVAEKRRIIADLEKKIAPLQLLAPAAATVTEVVVKVGDTVKPGDPAIKLANPSLFAEFQLPVEEMANLAQGKMVRLEAIAGGAAEDGQVAAAADGKVKVELLNNAGALKQGDEVHIVKAKLPNVIAIPLAAVTKNASGAEQVFVNEQGVAHARPVVIAERDGTNALVSSGVRAGDDVVTSAPAPLQEGQKVTTSPPAK